MNAVNGAGPKGSAPSLLKNKHFACTACGKCCTRGPEMELSEATALADVFVTRLLFRIHAVPNDLRTPGADGWLGAEGSSASPGQAIVDAHRHAARFSTAWDKDADGWTRYLMISALPVHAATGRCPALMDTRCAIYDRRPLSCRTEPFHYSRPGATLGAQLARFTATPGYQCDTGADAPIALRKGRLADAQLKTLRADAVKLHAVEAPWRAAITTAIKSADADSLGLPDYQSILLHSRGGGASSVSMAAAWRIAQKAGLLAPDAAAQVYEHQRRLLRAAGDSFREMLADYEN